MEYKVSVIMPVYNREASMATAIDSVLRQTLQEIELILVDDGSTDGSVEVAKDYARKHLNVKVFQQENAGPGIARNTGLDHATGEYVIFLDSDDWVPEHAYKALYEKAKETDADIVVGQLLRRIDGGKWFVPPQIKATFDRMAGINCAGNYELPIYNPACWNRLCRRSMLEKNHIRFGNGRIGEDMLFNIMIFQAARSVYTIEDIVYMYESDYSKETSQITNINAGIITSGFEVLQSYVLLFDKMGRVDWEDANLAGLFNFILQRFWKLPDGEEKNAVFESVKRYLSNYQGRLEYKITIEHLMGMDLDILLTLPYATYKRQKEFLQGRTGTQKKPGGSVWSGDPKSTVLTMYQNGEIGFRYILRYFKAWIRFKLKGKK